jgi:Rad3-related DNA helicase
MEAVAVRSMELGLYDSRGELPPLRYSTGKTQLDVVKQILETFESSDVVFLRATVGSGKSVIGIRTGIELGRAVIAVPTKVLSDQYVQSYERDKFFKRGDGSRVRIGILKGRRNFPCLYAKDRGLRIDASAIKIPCRRRLNRRTGETRQAALSECRHWGFIFPRSVARELAVRKLVYRGLAGEWALCLRGECPYWKQFEAYAFADVIVMNSAKWASEVAIGRLPAVGLTVVDEADGWLDSLALRLTVREEFIRDAAARMEDQEDRKRLDSLWEDVVAKRIDPIWFASELVSVLEEADETETRVFWKLQWVLEHREHVEVEVKDRSVSYLVPDPAPVLRWVMERVGGKWLLMSATCQSPEVLREIFGIDPVFVEGEVRFPGRVRVRQTGSELPVTHSGWADERFRARYWELLAQMFERAAKPCFVPVHAFKYLPPDLERKLRGGGDDFVESKGVVLSTKMDRGADLRGMRSIIVLKFPYPEREDPLLRGMERRLGKRAFWRYYRDVAERNFIQQVGRVLRSDSDEVEFWSPDRTCHRMLFKLWKGKIEVSACSR